MGLKEHHDVFFMSIILFFGTFFVCVYLKKIRNTKFLKSYVSLTGREGEGGKGEGSLLICTSKWQISFSIYPPGRFPHSLALSLPLSSIADAVPVQ